jgi:pantothenate kinase
MKSKCAVDIGGTLAKLVYVSDETEVNTEGDPDAPDSVLRVNDTSLKFKHFYTERIDQLVDFLRGKELMCRRHATFVEVLQSEVLR